MDPIDAQVATLTERLTSVNDKVGAAHGRLDKMEILIRDDLKEINEGFKEVSGELKVVVAWMNRSKGWAAAAFVAASIFGSIISFLATKLL